MTKKWNKPKEVRTAIIYVRVSSKEQVEGYSLDSQEKHCRAYAEKHGLKVLQVFREEGESAKTADRTELQKMVRYSLKNQSRIGKLIIYKIDRLARNNNDYFALKTIFERYKIDIQSATEAINNDPSGRLMEGVLAAIAEFDNGVRAQRTVEGMRSALEKGYWVFQAPWGYKFEEDELKNKVLVIDKDKELLIHFAFYEYAKGIYTFREVAEKINRMSGENISNQLLVKILKNPLYCGRVEVPRWEIASKGRHEPIVDEKLFDRVQFVLQGGNPHKQPRNRHNPDFPLRGFLCGYCKKMMTGGKTRGKTGKRYSYYHCSNKSCRGKKSMNKQDYEDEFSQFLRELVPRLDHLEILKEGIKLAYKEELGHITLENAKLESEIKELEDQREKALKLMVKDESMRFELKEYRDKLEVEIQGLKIRQLGSGLGDMDVEQAIEFTFSLIKSLPQKWEAFDPADLKVLRNILFPENLTYCYPGFQTPELSFIYKLNRIQSDEKTSLVALRGIEPRFGG